MGFSGFGHVCILVCVIWSIFVLWFLAGIQDGFRLFLRGILESEGGAGGAGLCPAPSPGGV